MVIPGSHKRDVVWNPRGAWQNQSGNTRWVDMNEDVRSLFVELTGKAGTAVVFTHDIIHQSYHETDSYRRVVHLTYEHGDQRNGCRLFVCITIIATTTTTIIFVHDHCVPNRAGCYPRCVCADANVSVQRLHQTKTCSTQR